MCWSDLCIAVYHSVFFDTTSGGAKVSTSNPSGFSVQSMFFAAASNTQVNASLFNGLGSDFTFLKLNVGATTITSHVELQIILQE